MKPKFVTFQAENVALHLLSQRPKELLTHLTKRASPNDFRRAQILLRNTFTLLESKESSSQRSVCTDHNNLKCRYKSIVSPAPTSIKKKEVKAKKVARPSNYYRIDYFSISHFSLSSFSLLFKCPKNIS